jgi:hypothetical protein
MIVCFVAIITIFDFCSALSIALHQPIQYYEHAMTYHPGMVNQLQGEIPVDPPRTSDENYEDTHHTNERERGERVDSGWMGVIVWRG